MFRDTKSPIKKSKTINVLIANGGMGDLVCTIPALLYLTKELPWLNPLIWVPDYLKDFAKHYLPPGVSVRNYTEAKTKFNDKLPGITTEWKHNKTAMRVHAVDYSFYALMDMKAPSEQARSYPRIRASEIDTSKYNLPEKYVVVQATSAEIVKKMPDDTMANIVEYVKTKGYTPVFIGAEKVVTGLKGDEGRVVPKANIDFDSEGINLINKTNLLELAAVIDGAFAYIGMDGGPTHIAGFTKTPIIAGFTFASPDHIMPIRDGIAGKDVYPIVPDSSLKCRFCQTNWALLYDHDFRDCYYKDFACTKMMTFDKFKEQLDKVFV